MGHHIPSIQLLKSALDPGQDVQPLDGVFDRRAGRELLDRLEDLLVGGGSVMPGLWT